MSLQRQEQKSDQQYGYCHQCKQLKKMSLLAECKYDSDKMGMQSPISTTVSDVSIFNGKSPLSPTTLDEKAHSIFSAQLTS